MTLNWLRRRWLWVLGAAVVVTVVVGGAGVWATRDSRAPLHQDCATVERLGRQAHELTTWLNTGLNDGTLSDAGEIVERNTALSDGLRAAAEAVATPAMKQPLTAWADAAALFAQLQREANKLPPDTYPSGEWVANVHKYNTMTDEAVTALDRQCSGLKQVVYGP